MLTCYLDDQLRPVIGASRHIFDLAKCEHAVDHLTKYDVLPVEEVTLGCSYKELTPIRVWTGVSLKDVKMRMKLTWTAVPLTEDQGPYASPGSFRPNRGLNTAAR